MLTSLEARKLLLAGLDGEDAAFAAFLDALDLGDIADVNNVYLTTTSLREKTMRSPYHVCTFRPRRDSRGNWRWIESGGLNMYVTKLACIQLGYWSGWWGRLRGVPVWYTPCVVTRRPARIR